MVGLNPEYLHELMWGAAPRAALARALVAGKLFHFDINDGYRLKHDVDIGIGLVNPLDWLNVLVLLRSHNYTGPFNLDYKPPRTTSQFGVFEVSFPSAVDRFITLWEMAGEAIADPVIKEATDALKAGAEYSGDPRDAQAITAAHRELLTLHELIAHRLVQILWGAHQGRVFSIRDRRDLSQRQGSSQSRSEVFPGQRLARFHQLARRSLKHDLATFGACARPHVDDPIGARDDIQVVLNHDHSGSVVDHRVEEREQVRHVGHVQTGRRLVENHDLRRLLRAHPPVSSVDVRRPTAC